MHRLILSLVVATAASSGACAPQPEVNTAEAAMAAAAEVQSSTATEYPTFNVPAPEQRPLLNLPARVETAPFVDLSFPIAGTLQEVNLTQGRIVTPDLPAARLNPAPLREAIESALNARTRALSAQTQAEAESHRQRLLFESGSVSENAVLSAQELLQARNFNLDLAEQAVADARAAEAASSMSGGVNGVVRQVHVGVGDHVAAGQSIYTVETDAIEGRVRFSLPASAAWVLKEPVAIEVSIGSGDRLSVKTIAPGSNKGEFSLTLRASPDTLRSGDDAQVHIRSNAPPTRIFVPFRALQEDATGIHVIVREVDGTLRRQAVKPAELAKNGVVLESGLAGGEVLVLCSRVNIF